MSDITDRTYPRVRVGATIDINTDELQLFNTIENISLGGVCIDTKDPEEVGTEIELVITMPDGGEEIILNGEVVWVAKTSEPKMGVRFLNFDAETKAKLQEYLYHRDQAGA